MAGVLRTFTRFFSVNVLARVDFFCMTTMAFGLGEPGPGQKPILHENFFFCFFSALKLQLESVPVRQLSGQKQNFFPSRFASNSMLS